MAIEPWLRRRTFFVDESSGRRYARDIRDGGFVVYDPKVHIGHLTDYVLHVQRGRTIHIASIGAHLVPLIDADSVPEVRSLYEAWLAQPRAPAIIPAITATRKELSPELRKVNERREHIQRLAREVLEPTTVHTRALVSPGELTDSDVDLAIEWLGGQFDIEDIRDWKEQGRQWLASTIGLPRSWHLERMLSARAAERAAITFLSGSGAAIRDVSLTQLSPSAADDWHRCDLRAETGDRSFEFDVKNARRPWKNRGVYTRWAVPAFKENRDSAAVQILGTLSPYYASLSFHLGLSSSDGLDATPDAVRILGVTQAPRLASLEDSISGNRILRFRNTTRKSVNGTSQRIGVLPAWAFETPKWLQNSRNKACEQLVKELTTDPETYRLLPSQARLPIAVALGLQPENLGVYALSRREAEFVEKLREARRSQGLTLAALFLTILSHFLSASRSSSGEASAFKPRMYTRLLFENAAFIDPDPYIRTGSWDASPREPWAPISRRQPLGLDDPLGTVWALIETLDTLWKEAGDSLALYEDFELVSWNILRARHVPSKKDRTILAYCGGITDVGPCGAWPLVMGREIHCDSGYLICSRCAYCCPTHCKNGRGPNSSPFTAERK